MSFNRWDTSIFSKLQSTINAEKARQGPNIGIEYQAKQLFNRYKTAVNPMTMDQARQQATALAQGKQAYDVASTAGTAVGAAQNLSKAAAFKDAVPVDAAKGLSTMSIAGMALSAAGKLLGQRSIKDGGQMPHNTRPPWNPSGMLIGQVDEHPPY